MYIIIMENLLVIGFLLHLAVIGAFVFKVFIRQNVLMQPTVPRVFSVVLVLLFLVVVGALFILLYQNEDLCAIYGIPLLVIEAFIIIGFLWFFAYLHGIERTSIELLKAIVGVLEAGDPNLDGHSLHVQKLTMLMYAHLPLHQRIAINPYNLEYASLLLDVGKLGVPRSIIQKAGKLEKDEWEFMRRHPGIGVKILHPVAMSSPILRWIKYHHERVDGSGYYHLEKDEIPLASRIIAVADTYSAVTMERSYKASLTYEEAISELKLAAGTQLDPALVDIFCSIPLRKIEACMADVHKQMQRYDEENFR
ncbi:MAG: HD domain-containing protein [Treponema sp.]|nr:HD domain-containing protein [Treponema sp.]